MGNMKNVKALALYSGGLDSILAARVVMAQGIEVEAVQFVTPFFNYEILDDIVAYSKKVRNTFGITVFVEDLSDNYLKMLRQPAHGFGKNFNPCIDCKILMMSRAKALMKERGASFLVSGEVLGQRPMSQRKQTFNIIERNSNTRSLLLRPLSAQLLPETRAESEGWVQRSELFQMHGRGRSAQIALAKKYGIADYPAPAGGCILADPILSRRISALYTGSTALLDADVISTDDVRSLLVGRQLLLPSGRRLIVGRDEGENARLTKLVNSEDALLLMEEWPGPTAVLKNAAKHTDQEALTADLRLAASLVVRYGKKIPSDDQNQRRTVFCTLKGEKSALETEVCAGDGYLQWVLP